jgi:serine/threonine protein kinase
MYKSKFKIGQQFGKWQLNKFLGAGGNGEVWQATLSDNPSESIAIKLLRKTDYEGYMRFKDEVKVLRENKDIKGLLQIIDYYLPENPKGRTPWYTMPLAIPIMKHIKGKSPEEIVDAIISIIYSFYGILQNSEISE